jgi:hypothetical protein
MAIRLAKVFLFILISTTVTIATFGEGEWENPDNAPNGNGGYGAGTVGPVETETAEPEPRTIEIASADDTTTVDEPVIELLADAFPIVRADDAAAPKPRNPKRVLDSVDVMGLSDKLAFDRLLLSEIRKDVPEAREEAELYLERLKGLAERSDPVRLAPLFDRVLDQAPIYFKWLETEYENPDEQITEYYVGGARGFAFAMENFRNAVFFVIMNRLDIASRVISELDE